MTDSVRHVTVHNTDPFDSDGLKLPATAQEVGLVDGVGKGASSACTDYAEPRIGSLCSGYGGLDLGLMSVAGGSVAWHVENDKHPSAVLDARFPDVPNYGDLTAVDWTQVEPVDWFTAGYPCQPFSHAGKRRGSKDERHLWPYIANAIGVLRPRRVLLENVAGHVSLGLDAVLWDLAALGYDAVWGVVRAADAGAPHGRARVFIVATDAEHDGPDAAEIGRGLSASPGEGRLSQPQGRHATPTANPGSERHGRGQDGRSLGRVDGEDAGEAQQRERSRSITGDRGAAAVAHAGSGPLTGSAATGDGLSVVAERGTVPAADTDRSGRHVGEEQHRDEAPTTADRDSRGKHADGPSGAVAWGAYEFAVRRWERILGRPAPRPTEPGPSGERLSPRFVEWMQGLPDGWVTDVLSRNPALKALGNGVVPQQAALAVRLLLARMTEEAAA